MASYRVFFLGESGGVIGSHDFEAPSDPIATAVAVLLSDACSDVCDGFQVWQGKRRIAALWPLNGATRAIAVRMNEAARKIATECERQLLRSRSRIAESKILSTREAARKG